MVGCREIHVFYKTARSKQTFISPNRHLLPVRVIVMDGIEEYALNLPGHTHTQTHTQ